VAQIWNRRSLRIISSTKNGCRARSGARLQKVDFGGDGKAIEAGEIEGFICARTYIRDVLQSTQL
jgi:hypothetical protein